MGEKMIKWIILEYEEGPDHNWESRDIHFRPPNDDYNYTLNEYITRWTRYLITPNWITENFLNIKF